MSAVLVGRFKPGSPEWHAAREHGLGGSEIAPVLGLSPFESRFALWHRKAARLGPVEVTEIMEAGNRLEDAICQRFADDHPELCVARSGTYRHADRPWQIANPDREIRTPCDCSSHIDGCHIDGPLRPNGMAACCDPNDCGPCCENCPTCPTIARATNALLEAKFALYPDGWGEPGTDQIPLHYKCQTQWYLDVFGLAVCYVIVFIGSQGRFVEYVVHADPRGQALMRERAQAFLASIERDERPSIDAHDATYQAVREMHPLIEPRKVEVPAAIAVPYTKAKAAEAAAKATAQQATAVLADAMGNAHTATYADTPIATRRARKGGTPYVQAVDNLQPLDIELREAS